MSDKIVFYNNIHIANTRGRSQILLSLSVKHQQVNFVLSIKTRVKNFINSKYIDHKIGANFRFDNNNLFENTVIATHAISKSYSGNGRYSQHDSKSRDRRRDCNNKSLNTRHAYLPLSLVELAG